MRNVDTPSMSVERMRESQSKLKTPYLVLSGQVKPGYGLPSFLFSSDYFCAFNYCEFFRQTSDSRSSFATMED